MSLLRSPTEPSRPARTAGVWLAAALTLALAGCQEEGVTTYTVPKEAPPAPRPAGGEKRLLAAIVKLGGESWFFKLMGPTGTVEEQSRAFNDFLETVSFHDQADKPEWKAPADWRPAAADPQHGVEAAYELGPENSPAKLSISHAGGDLKANLDRWCLQQLGRPALGPEEMARLPRTKIGGVVAIRVDLTGPGADGARPPHPPIGPAKAPDVKYQAPDDWKRAPDNQFSKLRFQVGDGAVVTFSEMPPQDPLLNVNRWRVDQVGLPATTAEQLAREKRSLNLPGAEVVYVDLEGKDTRLLGVLATRDGRTLVFKMIGPPDLVGKQKAAFESFVKSVQMD